MIQVGYKYGMSKNTTKGQLFLVALPIGNAKDITLRAKEVLETVDAVACEDTRSLKAQLKTWNLKVKRLLSHHEHNEKESAQGLIDLLNQGQSLAIVSDAGTPNIHDPGFSITQACQNEGIPFTSIPGASSLTTALSLSTLGGNSHLFLGFLPSKSSHRQNALRDSKSIPHRLVCFEAPHRLLDLLNDAKEILGDTKVEVFRELTKPFEECFSGSMSQAIAHFSKDPVRGELVVIFEAPKSNTDLTDDELLAEIKDHLASGKDHKKLLSEYQAKGFAKKRIYALIERAREELPCL
jgi:16S rRNA (cytidine1402-2'-O)-methyltransferase